MRGQKGSCIGGSKHRWSSIDGKIRGEVPEAFKKRREGMETRGLKGNFEKIKGNGNLKVH